MHKSSKKLNRQQNKDVPYTPDPKHAFLHSFFAGSRALPECLRNGPWPRSVFLLIASFPTKSTFPAPPSRATSSPKSPARPARNNSGHGLNQNIKRPALRLFGPNKSLPLHLQHPQSARLGHLCRLHGLPPPSPCLDQNSAECLWSNLLPATASHAIPRPVGSRAQCGRPRARAIHDDCHAGF